MKPCKRLYRDYMAAGTQLNCLCVYLEHIFIFSHFRMSCDQAAQHPELPPRVRGLLQHFCPDMEGLLCLIGLIQPQALLYLLLGLVLAHLWCKEPHKNIHSFRPCNFSEEARKQILAVQSTTPKMIPRRWSSERSKSEGLPGPALSAPAVLRQSGNWIHQSKTTAHQDHYRQSRCEDTQKYLPHLTLQRASHHQVFRKNSPSNFRLKNAKETRFPQEGSQWYPRISTPSTPQRKEFSTPPLSSPLHLPPTAGATADGLVTLDHVSLQEFGPALSKWSQGHSSSSQSTFTLTLTHWPNTGLHTFTSQRCATLKTCITDEPHQTVTRGTVSCDRGSINSFTAQH